MVDDMGRARRLTGCSVFVIAGGRDHSCTGLAGPLHGVVANPARRARDKYRGLADQQRRESRGKQSPQGQRPSQGNARTRRKEQLFGETLERYQASYGGKDRGKLTFSALESQKLSPDSALVRGRWQLSFENGDERGGLFTLVLLQTLEGWRITHDHTSEDDTNEE